MRAEGGKVFIRLLNAGDADELLELRIRNRAFLRPWEPRRDAVNLDLPTQRDELGRMVQGASGDRSYHFGIFEGKTDDLVGTITLSNVARGSWQNATIGYFVDEEHNNLGFVTEAIELSVQLAFTELGLHRVQAAVMPRNPASVRALEKAGFRREGMSPHYLQINGVWEDHQMFAITTEDLPTPPGVLRGSSDR